jgi:transcriptional regulator with XRE-family HTH domain
MRSMNWSQQDLAEAPGLDRTYVSALENGHQNMTIGALVRIAMALRVPADELLRHYGSEYIKAARHAIVA